MPTHLIQPGAGPLGSSPPGTPHRGTIVLINPPYERIAPGYSFVKHISNRSPSLGLLHLAAVVRQAGYRPIIIESDVEDLDAHQVAQRALAHNPVAVGITLFTVGVWQSATIARLLKIARPSLPIIVGGPHISSMGRETIARFADFDCAVVGEGEYVLIELLEALTRKPAEAALNTTSTPSTPHRPHPLARVPGLIFRDAGQIVTTPRPETPTVLDELPFPAWDLLPGFPHAYKPAIYDYPRGPAATIAASRGCPFHCRFCDTSTFGSRVRYYSPAKVYEMMVHLRDRYNVRHVLFVDDLFLASRLRALELCRLIVEDGLKMTWSCAARVDTVRPDLLAQMKLAGCWQISFGLETGSDELLQKMEKVARVARCEQAVRWTNDAGIRVKGLFMLGYPGETRQTIELTKAYVKRLPMDIMNLTKFTPYPGSPVYREVYGTNIRDDHWQKMNGMNFVWSPPGLSVEDLDRSYQDVIRAFYHDKRVRRSYAKTSLRHPGHLLRLSRAGVGLLAAKAASALRGRRGLLVRTDRPDLDASGSPGSMDSTGGTSPTPAAHIDADLPRPALAPGADQAEAGACSTPSHQHTHDHKHAGDLNGPHATASPASAGKSVTLTIGGVGPAHRHEGP
jgi:radical SAM superfamily enzyme YgiQ (UPF0313 family)